jgi:L-glutamine---4-(methylsulfanyl)-2-oxobutanoate aminotransferase
MRPAPDIVRRLPPQYFTDLLCAVAKARADPGERLIDLARGNPDLPPPERALKALADASLMTDETPVHGYPPVDGLGELRVALAARYREDHGVVLDPDTEIAVVPGTKSGIVAVVVGSANPGEAVLVPDPGYPDYLSAVALAGAHALPLPLDPTAAFQPSWDAVADMRPALVILNYPSNPCAVCERAGTFEHAIAYATDRDAWLMHDLAYGFLAFDGRRARSVLEIDGAREVAVELWSPSKVYGMAGWRIGFVVGNAQLISRVRLLFDHAASGVWLGFQRALLAALEHDQADVHARRAIYQTRRDVLVAHLRDAGAEIALPEGSFYVWWKLPEGVSVEALIAKARVGIAPGDGFGLRGERWARLSLTAIDADISIAGERLATALDES